MRERERALKMWQVNGLSTKNNGWPLKPPFLTMELWVRLDRLGGLEAKTPNSSDQK